MGRSSIPPALIELSNPSTPEAQVAALQSLKNEIVGHEQRKELAVTHGVVKPLAGLLRSEARKGGKRRRGQSNGHGSSLFTENARSSGDMAQWTIEDELRFQATLIVGSLANGKNIHGQLNSIEKLTYYIGGPAFISPLLAGGVLPSLLEALRLGETPSKLVTTTLMTLNQVVDAVAQEKPWLDSSAPSTLAYAVNEQLYTKPVIESLAEILAQPAGTIKANQQINAAVRLIMKTCQDDAAKRMLVEANILDTLAGKLAAIAAADESSQDPETKPASRDQLPRSSLSDILEAISAIIKDSHYYTARFLYSQSTQQLFGWPKDRASTAYEGYSNSSKSHSWDKLIPRVQTMTSKSDAYTKTWPALGSYTSGGDSFSRLPSVDALQQTSGRSVITDESESPLFIWLMYVARRGEGRERLSACWLLALLKKFGDRWPLNDPSKVTRERHFSYLVIPLVVKMIEESNPISEHAKRAHSLGATARDEVRFMLERSPLVLAELVAGNKPLQSAAVDARILPTLVQILKKSFDTVASSSKPLWQPKSSSHEVKDPAIDPASSTLGRLGLSADVIHAFKYRESVLLALAALAADQDSLRKLVIEMGAATHIIEAMVPYSENNEPNVASATVKDGNPEPVLVAACKVTRSLSRSVSVLRTSLIDHGVAQPVYELLMHPSVKVQIAATEVITNLVLDMSPMRPVSYLPDHICRMLIRKEIMEAGVLRALCEQCRSANFNLRFGSLWALKHLCLGLPPSMRIQCLDELGVGWLVQVLNGEPNKPAMGTPNAAGEQVDLLNAVDEPQMDVDEEDSEEDEDDEDIMADNMPSMRRPGSRYTSAINIRDRLQQIKNDEQDVRLNNERDDIRLQEQALDFIRNFITESQNTGEMIDHLLKAFGHSRFFEILDSKLRPKNSSSSLPGASHHGSNTAPTYWNNSTQRGSYYPATHTLSTQQVQQLNWSTYPAPEIVHAAMFVLVHIANGRPQHKSLLISQTSIMHHVHSLLYHPRRDVRIACAWMLHNLIWLEDSSDQAAARERASLLRGMSFEEGAKTLARDMDADVRERAKTVVDSLHRLLGEAGQSQSQGQQQQSRTSGYSGHGQGFGGGDSGLGGMGMGASGGAGESRLGGLHGWGAETRGRR